MVEVTSFNVVDNQTLNALALVGNSDCIYIEGIQSIDVFGLDILDSVEERRLVWRRLILLSKSHHLVCLHPHHYLQ